MASDCTNVFMPTPCHDLYDDISIGAYLDSYNITHEGWTPSECQSFGRNHYERRHCGSTGNIRNVKERSIMRSASGTPNRPKKFTPPKNATLIGLAVLAIGYVVYKKMK